jgi:ABC-type antimicrobial peptide transport system permease subunit
VFYLRYMLAELRRRRGRTILTAVGLAVGVGVVVAVNALSTGLHRAQNAVLDPLTGVGTDLSVSRPIAASGRELDDLSPEERRQLEEENRGARVGFHDLKPGEKFSEDTFVSTAQLSFPASEVDDVRGLDGVSAAAGGLTLSALHVEGRAPKDTGEPQFFQEQAPQPSQGPRSIGLDPLTVTGVDQTHPELGAMTSGQVTSGRYFTAPDSGREAIVNVSYAKRQKLEVGDRIEVGGKEFEIVGLAETPLGGQSSDVYIKLGQLQRMSDREDRVNTIYVRATSSDRVAAIAKEIEATFEGSSVTTAEDLADRVSGSLVNAKDLVGTLGTALAIVGVLAAFLIAAVLTLSSVAKRIRELGTLKALGWRQRQVVRQVAGESILQGLLGGLLGAGIGVAAAALIETIVPSLDATVAEAAQAAGPFGQGAVSSGSTTVSLDAPVGPGVLLVAIGLAVAGGLLAGIAGGLRAARLRPADALRHID